MKNQNLKVFHGMYLLAFLLGLFIRTYFLGSLKLGDAEASNALQAFTVSKGMFIGGQNFYSIITGILFLVIGSSEFLARIIPATIGSLIIVVPYLLRDWIGHWAAIIVAFGLALDPGLIAVSRQADSAMLSITFLMIGLSLVIRRKLVWGGITFGLFFLSGESIWWGCLGIGIAFGWSWGIHRFNKETIRNIIAPLTLLEWKKLGVWVLGTYLSVGTLFFIIPTGISAITNSFVDYIHSWFEIGSPIIIVFFAFIAYELFVFIFGFAGVFKSSLAKSELDKFLTRWFFVAFLLVLITPGRNLNGFAWSIFPLWLLAGRTFEGWLRNFKIESRMILAAQGAITLVLLLFIWLNLSALINPTVTGSEIDTLRVISCIVALVLILLIGVLIGVGWTSKQSIYGLLTGFVIFLLLFSLSASWNAAGLGENPASEIWRKDAYPKELDLLTKTMSDISEWKNGTRSFQDVIVVGIDSPSLKWAFRDQGNVEYASIIPPETTTTFVITRPGNPLSTPVSYSGQDFTGWQIPSWKLLFPVEWVRWLIFREVPMENDTLILWVRSDQFPGALQLITDIN